MASVITGPDEATTRINYFIQSGDRRNSPIVCPDSAGQDAGKSDQPKGTHTLTDRMAHKPDSATAGQYSSRMDGSWSDSAVTSNHSARQSNDSPDSDTVGIRYRMV